MSTADEPPSAAASPSALDEGAMPPGGTASEMPSMSVLDEAAIESESESAERDARAEGGAGTAQGSRIPTAAQCTE